MWHGDRGLSPGRFALEMTYRTCLKRSHSKIRSWDAGSFKSVNDICTGGFLCNVCRHYIVSSSGFCLFRLFLLPLFSNWCCGLC
uniref:Uncharacterized protein n=1 Tax=Setaria italica TaxID=4555 RepID=K4A3N3_SETIT